MSCYDCKGCKHCQQNAGTTHVVHAREEESPVKIISVSRKPETEDGQTGGNVYT